MIHRCEAGPEGALPDDAVRAFRRDGVLVVERFVEPAACDRLRARAVELVEAFEPSEQRTVFSTHDQRHARDRYFEESAGGIGYFFEEEAFDDAGRLRQAKEESINKIGHALHDLDPVFDAFSHGRRLAAVAASVGLPSALVVQSMYIRHLHLRLPIRGARHGDTRLSGVRAAGRTDGRPRGSGARLQSDLPRAGLRDVPALARRREHVRHVVPAPFGPAMTRRTGFIDSA